MPTHASVQEAGVIDNHEKRGNNEHICLQISSSRYVVEIERCVYCLISDVRPCSRLNLRKLSAM